MCANKIMLDLLFVILCYVCQDVLRNLSNKAKNKTIARSSMYDSQPKEGFVGLRIFKVCSYNHSCLVKRCPFVFCFFFFFTFYRKLFAGFPVPPHSIMPSPPNTNVSTHHSFAVDYSFTC